MIRLPFKDITKISLIWFPVMTASLCFLRVSIVRWQQLPRLTFQSFVEVNHLVDYSSILVKINKVNDVMIFVQPIIIEICHLIFLVDTFLYSLHIVWMWKIVSAIYVTLKKTNYYNINWKSIYAQFSTYVNLLRNRQIISSVSMGSDQCYQNWYFV